ncbi:ribonuclease P protein component [Collinsella sp. zg1085]|uniref:ribonuclease P protein component n=1 Tax=Collinsella sp. zg1085 TaxID=2844380 RepID=UPI001C0D811C|nr:ribonuclease P protein component [Collinsella sp. zg1085]QWT17600.1 ribonuclease P protein component [Collinsella sp. zg1085]
MKTLKSRQDFERVFTQGKRYNHPLIRLTVSRTTHEGDPYRVAFVAAKRLGNAVLRNRSKRVLRETLRSCPPLPLGYELILFATAQTSTASPSDMTRALIKLLQRAGLYE